MSSHKLILIPISAQYDSGDIEQTYYYYSEVFYTRTLPLHNKA